MAGESRRAYRIACKCGEVGICPDGCPCGLRRRVAAFAVVWSRCIRWDASPRHTRSEESVVLNNGASTDQHTETSTIRGEQVDTSCAIHCEIEVSRVATCDAQLDCACRKVSARLFRKHGEGELPLSHGSVWQMHESALMSMVLRPAVKCKPILVHHCNESRVRSGALLHSQAPQLPCQAQSPPTCSCFELAGATIVRMSASQHLAHMRYVHTALPCPATKALNQQ